MSRSTTGFFKKLLPSQWGRSQQANADSPIDRLPSELQEQLLGLPPELRQQAYRQLRNARGGRAKVWYHIDDSDGSVEEDDHQYRMAIERSLQQSAQATPSPPDRVVAEFYEHGALGHDIGLPDGFYACFGHFPEVADRGQVPLLPNLRLCKVLEGREVVLFDASSDAALTAFRDEVIVASRARFGDWGPGKAGLDVGQAARLAAEFVAALLVGEGTGASGDAAARAYWPRSYQLQQEQASVIVPVGRLRHGLLQHRALLCKLALGWLGVPAAVGRNHAIGGDALSLFVRQNGAEVEVDLDSRPGALAMRTESGSASGSATATTAHSAFVSSFATADAPSRTHTPPPGTASSSHGTHSGAQQSTTSSPPVPQHSAQHTLSRGPDGSSLMDSADVDSMLASPMRSGLHRSSRAASAAQLPRSLGVAAAYGAGAPQSTPLDRGATRAPQRSRSPLGAGAGLPLPPPIMFANQLPNPFLVPSAAARAALAPQPAALDLQWPFDQPDLLLAAVRPRRHPRGAVGHAPSASSPDVSALAGIGVAAVARAPGGAGRRDPTGPLGGDAATLPASPRPPALAHSESLPKDSERWTQLGASRPLPSATDTDTSAASSPRPAAPLRAAATNGAHAHSARHGAGRPPPLRGAPESAGSYASNVSTSRPTGGRAELRASAFADPDGSAPHVAAGDAPSSVSSRFASGAGVHEDMPWWASGSRVDGSFLATSEGSGDRRGSGTAARALSSLGPAPSDSDALASRASEGPVDTAAAPPDAASAPPTLIAGMGLLTPVPETKPLPAPASHGRLAGFVSAFGDDDSSESDGGSPLREAGFAPGHGGPGTARAGIFGSAFGGGAEADDVPGSGAAMAGQWGHGGGNAAVFVSAFGDGDSDGDGDGDGDGSGGGQGEEAPWGSRRRGLYGGNSSERLAPGERAGTPRREAEAGGGGGAPVLHAETAEPPDLADSSSGGISGQLSSVLAAGGAPTVSPLTTPAALLTDPRSAAIQSAVSAALSLEASGPMSGAEANLRSLAAIRSVRRMENLFRMWIREADVKLTDQVIGRGAYGQVMLAKFRTERCAVKQIICETKDEYRASMQEMLLMQELQFDKIVRFFGAIKHSSRCIWMCMEYMPFSDLRKVLHSRKHRQEVRFPEHLLTLQRRLKWAKDVVAALDLLHSRYVVHRDLKPGNILISNRFDAVLSDFGLSRVRQAQQSRLQASGFGTVSYAAPEALSNNHVSPASDMFSFGCVLWELLSLREPWADLSGAAFQIMSRVIYEHKSLAVEDIPEDIQARIPEVIAELRRCFSFEPAARPSAVHMHEVLEAAVEGM